MPKGESLDYAEDAGIYQKWQEQTRVAGRGMPTFYTQEQSVLDQLQRDTIKPSNNNQYNRPGYEKIQQMSAKAQNMNIWKP